MNRRNDADEDCDEDLKKLTDFLEGNRLFDKEVGTWLDYAERECNIHALRYNKKRALILNIDTENNGWALVVKVSYIPQRDHYTFERLWIFENGKFSDTPLEDKKDLAKIVKDYKPFFSKLAPLSRFALSEAYDLADRI